MSTALEAAGRLRALDPAAYERHALHQPDRSWPETTCYADLWIELLHALGLQPEPALAFAVTTGFEGDQWTFAKPSLSDLDLLYGIEVTELTVWRTLAEHIATQRERGNLLTIEVDAHHLADTAGVTYGVGHSKTTIVPVRLDVTARELDYFHNAGFFRATGDDVAALFGGPDPLLPPYVELVRLDRVRAAADATLVAQACAVLAAHVARIPSENPFVAYGEWLAADNDRLVSGGLDAFHQYAFATVRNYGSAFALAASSCRWLASRAPDLEDALTTAGDAYEAIGEAAKTTQFKLARVAAGRKGGVDELVAEQAAAWHRATDALRGLFVPSAPG